MAEIKTGIFAKNVQKRLNRAQEKVLQKLGKADETKDEQFEQLVINFKRQEVEGSRLQREMKSYMSAIKGMQQASINLTQSLHEVYEPDWHGKDDITVIGKDCDALWEVFHNKLIDSTLLNLDEYLQQFPDLKTRVAKRSRKLIDYDSARHHVETLQVSGMKNDRKMMKAEDELKKAQRVFDELNVGLQNELPALWDSRVEFYISTFLCVTSHEAKFHEEISLVCRQLYEVMTQLAEQHSDKMFTIQGAPSDSGPLRLARTPSPPEDESPPESPEASSNHTLRPISPGPPRPKSPAQLKKGPPVPPPPKVTPTKEVAEEQIIDLFGGEFLPAPSPSQPNERPGESLLDLDFDAFQPDESVSPIPQTAVPWDMWSASAQTAQPAADAGFVADWSADFGSLSANGEAPPGAEAAVGLERAEGGEQGGAQVDGRLPGDVTTTPPQDSEAAAEVKVSSPDYPNFPDLNPSVVKGDEDRTWGADAAWQEGRRKSTPGLIFTNEYGEQIEDSTEDRGDKWSRSPDGSGSEYETAEEWGDGGQGGGWASADDELPNEDVPHVEGLGHDRVGQVLPESDEPDGNHSEKYTSTGGDAFDCDPFAETQGGGAFDCDPFAETQGRGAFDSDPFAETQGGGAFDSDPFAETQGRGAFDHDPSPETQGGGAFDSDLFAETQGGGAFDSDPFAETQGGGAFDSDPFAETQGRGVFDHDPSPETQGGGAFDSDPFAESQGGGAFDSDPFAESQGGGAFDSGPYAETQFADRGAGFDLQLSGKEGACGDGGSGWDPFANNIPAGPVSSTTSWQDVSGSGDFNSSVIGQNSASVSVTEGIKDMKVSRIHKEPENSDMSEDEAANRRLGKLYQELDTKKDEASDAFNGLSQDAATPSFFADFDKMNQDTAESMELHQGTEAAEGQDKASAPCTSEELPAPSVGGEVEEPDVPPTGDDEAPKHDDSAPKEEQPAVLPADEAPTSPGEAPPSEKMPIPSVVIEPASSNEGDDDRDADIISPTNTSGNDVTAGNQNIQHMSPSGSVSGLPDGFLYKVETMHDFEAANTDELELKRGDVVLVVPTASVEDQDAGWLTGIKESDWFTHGAAAQKGLFPENFIQRLE